MYNIDLKDKCGEKVGENWVTNKPSQVDIIKIFDKLLAKDSSSTLKYQYWQVLPQGRAAGTYLHINH